MRVGHGLLTARRGSGGRTVTRVMITLGFVASNLLQKIIMSVIVLKWVILSVIIKVLLRLNPPRTSATDCTADG